MKKLFNLFNKPKDNQTITIVSGLPRSGTSMMMKMLEAGGLPPITDNLRTADEDNPKGYYEFERVKKLKEGDTAWLPEAQGKVVKVISALLTDLPAAYHYRVVFMRRAMPEILASQRKMLIRRAEDPNKISDDEIAKLYEKHLAKVTRWLQDQTNISVLYVNYNQLVRNPEPLLPEINHFLGDALNASEMLDIIDSRLYRHRKA